MKERLKKKQKVMVGEIEDIRRVEDRYRITETITFRILSEKFDEFVDWIMKNFEVINIM